MKMLFLGALHFAMVVLYKLPTTSNKKDQFQWQTIQLRGGSRVLSHTQSHNLGAGKPQFQHWKRFFTWKLIVFGLYFYGPTSVRKYRTPKRAKTACVFSNVLTQNLWMIGSKLKIHLVVARILEQTVHEDEMDQTWSKHDPNHQFCNPKGRQMRQVDSDLRAESTWGYLKGIQRGRLRCVVPGKNVLLLFPSEWQSGGTNFCEKRRPHRVAILNVDHIFCGDIRL